MEEVNVILANRKGLGAVKLCGCNTIHLSIGPVTMALAPEAFAQAATLLQEAMQKFQKINETRDAQAAQDLSELPHSNHWTH